MLRQPALTLAPTAPSSHCRTQVVLPDKRPLPSVLTDVEKLKARLPSGSAPLLQPPGPKQQDSSDDAFLQGFEVQKLDYW